MDIEVRVCKKCKREIQEGFAFCPYCGKKIAADKKRPRRPNGAGSVCKVSGKRKKPWLARVQVNDSRKTVGYYQTEAEALKAIALYDPNKSVVHKSMTLKAVWEIIEQRKTNTLSISARQTRKASFDKLKPLWDKDVSKLHSEDYQIILDSLAIKYATGTIVHVRSVISEIGKWCVANELLKFNPSEYLTTPRGNDKEMNEQDKIFTEEEIQKLWSDDSEDAHVVLVLIYTGLRINELFSLKPSDVHFDGEYNYIIGGEKSEAGKNRTVFLHPRIIPFFQTWVNNNNEHLIVNQYKKKCQIDTWRDIHYYPLLSRLGIRKINPHKTRHTFATRIAAAGGNISALQKTIGHASYSTTANIYTHPDMEALKKLIELQT